MKIKCILDIVASNTGNAIFKKDGIYEATSGIKGSIYAKDEFGAIQHMHDLKFYKLHFKEVKEG